jgi:hypothetical protein
VIAGDLLRPDPGLDASGDAADPYGSTLALEGRDRHVPQRRSYRRLALRVDLHGTDVDPELRQPTIGAPDPINPVDHE